MANRWPIASGNWSDSAIWSGSLIPTAADAVYANNRLVVVDQNIIVNSLNNSSTTGVTAGGSFYLTNGITVQAVIIGGNSGNYIAGGTGATATVTISGSNTAYITGSITTTNGNNNLAVSMSNTSNLYVTGSVITGGSSLANMGILSTSTGILNVSGTINPAQSAGQGGAGIWLVTPTTLIITGSVIGGSGVPTNGYGVYATTNSTISVQGNVTGGGGSTCYGIINISSASIYVNGQVKGGTGNNSNHGILAGGGTIIIVSGSVSGSSGTSNTGISNTSVSTIIVTGSITAGPGTTCIGINNTGNGIIDISGSVTAIGANAGITSTATTNIMRVLGTISSSILSVGISSTGTTATNIFTGPFYNTGSFNAVYAYRMQMLEPTSTSWRFDTEIAGGSKTLYTANQLPGVPRQNNVRKGVQYNFGLTGSLEMPDPTTVKSGVATDNTVGSAILTAQDMFDVLTQDIVSSGSIGETLDNVSTVQTVAATVSAFKV